MLPASNDSSQVKDGVDSPALFDIGLDVVIPVTFTWLPDSEMLSLVAITLPPDFTRRFTEMGLESDGVMVIFENIVMLLPLT